jgi:hypothetical protein
LAAFQRQPLLVDVEVAHAEVVAAVEVVGQRNARLLRRGLEGIQHVPAQALLLDAPFAAVAMELRHCRVGVTGAWGPAL